MKNVELKEAIAKYIESKELVLMGYPPEYIDDVKTDMEIAFRAGAEWFEKQKEQPTNEAILKALDKYEKCVADAIARYEQKEQVNTILKKAFEKSKIDFTLEEKKQAYDYAESILPTSITYGESEEEYQFHKIIEAAFIAGQKEQKPVEIHIDNPNIEKFDPDVKVTTSDSSASGEELVYVSNKAYNMGFRDGFNAKMPVTLPMWNKEDYAFLNKFELLAKSSNLPKDIVYWAMEHLRPLQNPTNSEIPKEWSEEEKDKVVRYLHDRDGGMLWSKATEITKDILDMLRPSWKPDGQQLDCLRHMINVSTVGKIDKQLVQDLYEQLKKLGVKEEPEYYQHFDPDC